MVKTIGEKEVVDNLIFRSYASDPTPATEGMIYYNSVINGFKYYTDGEWKEL